MKAQASPPQRQVPHSRANTNRRFRYPSRAIKDNRSGTTAPHAAFALIQRSARVLAQRQALDAIHDSRRMVAQRNAFASMFQRPTASHSPSSVIQCYQVINQAYAENDGGRAGLSWLRIRLDGKIGGPGHNNPVNPQLFVPGRDRIRGAYKLQASEPFAMHLVNGRLGGSGTDRGNLAWGSHNFNVKHCQVWEQARQDQAANINNTGCVMDMTVVAMYKGTDPNHADYYYLNALMCTHSLEDPQGKVIDATQDVPIFDNKEYQEMDEDYNPALGDVVPYY
jgi:hypothetical protein